MKTIFMLITGFILASCVTSKPNPEITSIIQDMDRLGPALPSGFDLLKYLKLDREGNTLNKGIRGMGVSIKIQKNYYLKVTFEGQFISQGPPGAPRPYKIQSVSLFQRNELIGQWYFGTGRKKYSSEGKP